MIDHEDQIRVAVGDAGRTPDSIIVVGFDASPDEVAAIVAGTQDASVAQFPAKMGELGIETTYKAVIGEAMEANVDTGTALMAAKFGIPVCACRWSRAVRVRAALGDLRLHRGRRLA